MLRLTYYKIINRKRITGFTLVEVLVASVIFSFAVVGILAGYVNFVALNDYNRNLTSANAEAREEIEEIMGAGISEEMDPTPLALQLDSGVPALMQTQTEDLQGSGIYNVRVAICWREKNGRLIGEVAQRADGSLFWVDGNTNGKMDSPVVLETAVTANPY